MTSDSLRRRPRRWLAFSQLRFKIASPYVFLAIVVAIVAAFLITRLIHGSLEERFQNALLDAGRLAADALALRERDLLTTLRATAFTQGLPRAVRDRDRVTVRRLVEPLAVNAQVDAIAILDADGRALFSMQRDPTGGPTDYLFDQIQSAAGWDFVHWVLRGEVDERGDKIAGLAEQPGSRMLYVAGPTKLNGDRVGVILVGESLTRLAQRLDAAALARVTLYDRSGQALVSTLGAVELAALAVDAALVEPTLALNSHSPQRMLALAGRSYLEYLNRLQVRSGEAIGLLGVALSTEFLTTLQIPTQGVLIGLFSFLTVFTLLIGAWLAAQIVRPVRRLTNASEHVAKGQLDVSVEVTSRDEIGRLTEAFNIMVNDLREGRLYRDLLGRTASPEVAEQLRKGLSSGKIQLAGQRVEATILYSDIRGFTTLSERYKPEAVMALLNAYLVGTIEIVLEHGGIVNKLGGDSMLSFFGVLPEPRPTLESACQAVRAALAIQTHLAHFNRQLIAQGGQLLRVGIGVHTGPVVAGTLGSPERLEYTLIGDAVNVAQRLSDLNKTASRYDVFVSRATCALVRTQLDRSFQSLGLIQLKGRSDPIEVFAIGGAR